MPYDLNTAAACTTVRNIKEWDLLGDSEIALPFVINSLKDESDESGYPACVASSEGANFAGYLIGLDSFGSHAVIKTFPGEKMAVIDVRMVGRVRNASLRTLARIKAARIEEVFK